MKKAVWVVYVCHHTFYRGEYLVQGKNSPFNMTNGKTLNEMRIVFKSSYICSYIHILFLFTYLSQFWILLWRLQIFKAYVENCFAYAFSMGYFKLPAFEKGLGVTCGLQETVCYFTLSLMSLTICNSINHNKKHNFKIILFTCYNSHRKFHYA